MIYDIVILGILLLFGGYGYHRGLISSLSGILGFAVAFLGAGLLIRQFQPAVAEFLLSPVEQFLDQQLQRRIAESQASGTSVIPLPAGLTSLLGEESAAAVSSAIGTLVNGVVESERLQLVESIGGMVASTLAQYLLGLVGFTVILFIWRKVTKFLNRVCRLPVLRPLNRAGGLLLGCVEGGLLVWVCCQGLNVLGMLPQTADTTLMQFFLSRAV